MKFTVLVIDDDEEMGKYLKVLLGEDPSYRVLWAAGGAQGLRLASSELPDLIILDLRMPDIPGQEVCRRLKEREKTFHIPILVLTSDPGLTQEVSCINIGADDYLVKPVDGARLLARIKGLVRRFRFRGDLKGVIRIGGAALDTTACRLSIAGRRALALTPTETAIFALLMSGEGNCVDKQVLYKKVYNAWPRPSSATIRVHVCNIREKLGGFAGLVTNHKDQGYRFDVDYAQRLKRRLI